MFIASDREEEVKERERGLKIREMQTWLVYLISLGKKA